MISPLSPDDGAHPDCTPVQEYLHKLAQDPVERAGQQLRETLHQRLDNRFLDRLLAELPYGLSLAVGHKLADRMFRPPPPPPERKPQPKPDPVTSFLAVDNLAVHVGRGLVGLVEQVSSRVAALRRHLAWELGVIVPGVRFRDDLNLPGNGYQLFVRGVKVAEGAVCPGKVLAVGPEQKARRLELDVVQDPIWGMPAVWIDPQRRGDAETLGLMLFEPAPLLAAHLTEVIRARGHELLGLQEAQNLLDLTARTQPAVVREVLARLGLPEVTAVLQNLLREQVSIGDLPRILEVLARQAVRTKHPDELSELVRTSLREAICSPLLDRQGTLRAVELDEALAAELAQAYRFDEVEAVLSLPPARAREILGWVAEAHEEAWNDTDTPVGPVVVVTGPDARPALARLVHGQFAHLVVLSWAEIPPGTPMEVTSLVAG